MATPVKRPTGRDEVVEAVLDAADRLLAAGRPDQVSLRGIARRAEVNYGLVHRHFGTRDDLIDQLLQRTAHRWTAELEASGDYTSAVQTILSSADEAEASAGSWLRLLAWSLLTETPGESGQAQRRYATLDRLPALLNDDQTEATYTTATALSLVFGWRFFHPYIRAALHLEDVDFPVVHDAIRQHLSQIIER
jgi:AcrR family transcriptional regulator